MDDKTATVVVSAIVGLFPLLANTLVSALLGRSARSRRDDAITLARQRIQLLDEWVKAHETVSTPEHYADLKATASQELDTIHEGVIKALEQATPRLQRLKDRHLLERLFLLYRPESAASWVLHTLFYMSAAMFAAVVLLSALNLATGTAAEMVDYATFSLNVALPLLILAVVFRGLGALLDRQAEKRLEADALEH